MGKSTVNLEVYDNSDYYPGNIFKIFLWLLISRCFFETRLPLPSSLKIIILKLFGAKMAANIIIKPSVQIKYPWFLDVGANCWIGEKAWIDNLTPVTIGDNCCLSQQSMLLTGNHNFSSISFDLIMGEIKLESGCWVGARATVCPGVTMKRNSILTVGSTLTCDSEEDGIYQGNPAVLKKKRTFNT